MAAMRCRANIRGQATHVSGGRVGGALERVKAGGDQTRAEWHGAAAPWRRPVVGLLLVAIAFTAVQVIAVPLRLPLGWDEVVYASQASVHAPSAYFSAPRARGISVLATPAVALTSSTMVLRAWMSLLAGAGLVAAYWPWRRLLPGPVVVGAAACFASLWVVQFYADEVMPNLYVAYGTVAAVGWFLHAVSGPQRTRGALLALAASIAFTALVRPADAVFLALALLAAALAVRAWRQLRGVLAVLGGLAAGLLPWIVEAYARFGGPLARLRGGSDAQGGMHWTLAGVSTQLRALNGPMLCRPCEKTWAYPALSLWWFATPVLAAAGLLLAARARRAAPARLAVLALPTACALAVSVQYLFLLDYAAPRFLMPVYALLALPVAACAVGIARAAPDRWRPAVAAVLTLVFTAHVASQYLVLHRRTADQTRSRAALVQIADRLAGAGLRPPCTLTGADPVQMAYYAGCSSQTPTGTSAFTATSTVRQAVAEPAGQSPPDYTRDWTTCSITLPDSTVWHLYLAPSPGFSWHC